MDCPDPEEILRKIPELADELEQPDDCFTEGIRSMDLFFMLALMGLRVPPQLSPKCLGEQNHGPASRATKQQARSRPEAPVPDTSTGYVYATKTDSVYRPPSFPREHLVRL